MGNIVLSNVGNAIHSVYVFDLPAGPVWLLHSFYLVTTGLMLVWYLRYARPLSAGGPAANRGAHLQPVHAHLGALDLAAHVTAPVAVQELDVRVELALVPVPRAASGGHPLARVRPMDLDAADVERVPAVTDPHKTGSAQALRPTAPNGSASGRGSPLTRTSPRSGRHCETGTMPGSTNSRRPKNCAICSGSRAVILGSTNWFN